MEFNDRIEDRELSLTGKQREALNLLIQHKTSKEISRILGISPHTVDQRIESAKRKFGVDSRGELAQAYQQYLQSCQKLTYGISHIAEPVPSVDSSISDMPEDEQAKLDPPRIDLDGQGPPPVGYQVVHELFYGPIGTAYRLVAILIIAILLIVAVLGGISIFVSLTQVLR